jgi:hypothetical protein
VEAFRDLMLKTKHDLRDRLPKLDSEDSLNNLFRYPYTKIEFVEKELGISRVTASKYLEQLTKAVSRLRGEARGGLRPPPWRLGPGHGAHGGPALGRYRQPDPGRVDRRQG